LIPFHDEQVMSKYWVNPTSWVLAALYAFLANFGHALHDHGHQLQEQVDTQAACCQHDHCTKGRQQASGKASDAPHQSARQYETAHGEHACVACALISLISAGYSSLQDIPIATLSSSEMMVAAYDSPCFAVRNAASSERGPPLKPTS